MRTSVITVAAALAAALICPSLLPAQGQAPKPATANAHPASSQAFDPHDLNGIWEMDVAARGRDALQSISNDRPPLTAWGQAKAATARPGFPAPSFGVSKAPEKEWNDPEIICDPNGYPRSILHVTMARFVQTPNEILQFFEQDKTWRDIWTDGRKLPADPDPRYYGYAVAHWDGNTLVIDSNGFKDSTWIDRYGSPHSDQMTLRETVKRTGPSTLEWVITVTDPKAYTKPWVSEPIHFNLVPKSPRSETEELREDFCVWSDAHGFFSNIDDSGLGGSVVDRSH